MLKGLNLENLLTALEPLREGIRIEGSDFEEILLSLLSAIDEGEGSPNVPTKEGKKDAQAHLILPFLANLGIFRETAFLQENGEPEEVEGKVLERGEGKDLNLRTGDSATEEPLTSEVSPPHHKYLRQAFERDIPVPSEGETQFALPLTKVKDKLEELGFNMPVETRQKVDLKKEGLWETDTDVVADGKRAQVKGAINKIDSFDGQKIGPVNTEGKKTDNTNLILEKTSVKSESPTNFQRLKIEMDFTKHSGRKISKTEQTPVFLLIQGDKKELLHKSPDRSTLKNIEVKEPLKANDQPVKTDESADKEVVGDILRKEDTARAVPFNRKVEDTGHLVNREIGTFHKAQHKPVEANGGKGGGGNDTYPWSGGTSDDFSPVQYRTEESEFVEEIQRRELPEHRTRTEVKQINLRVEGANLKFRFQNTSINVDVRLQEQVEKNLSYLDAQKLSRSIQMLGLNLETLRVNGVDFIPRGVKIGRREERERFNIREDGELRKEALSSLSDSSNFSLLL